MAAVKPSLGRVLPGSSILFLCDMQEKFRHIAYFPEIVSVAARMLKELDTRPQLRSVLLCGIETQACILNTTLDLLDRGLQVHVVVDACSSRSQVDRLVALARMRQSGAFLSTSEGLILQLVGDAAHPQFKEIQKIIKEPAPDSGLLSLFQGQNPLFR
ncbi:isochorismatase domain-containing protein 2 isoform X9 [Zalophus californianus]|uniref:Isochorismatase domain-containing protein 2 isoform X9 n=1 Tax=Zalophus californianus TaxID=9704 RepID=A0A6P9F4Y0_ZALCA|nr:isochorismatase domain-containing protein 2 isoform X9 [Zalophus californianus]